MDYDHIRVQMLFDAVCDMSTIDRKLFLDKECEEEESLRSEVESLLKHYFSSAKTIGAPEKISDIAVDHQTGDTIGHYKILSVLGEGGMGMVYLASQSKPVRRKIALKIIKAGMDTKQIIARFEAERQALAIMNHPGIAQVYDAGATKEGRPYFVLEYVDGLPVTDACDEHKLNTRQRLELMAKVCDAIQHAHNKGIIHRDLKPSNIMVTVSDKNELEPKIIDFGVAKATTGQLTDNTVMTQIGRFIGTPAYMSPEQADLKAEQVDTRTDVYALGVVLYEVLTGKLPFSPKTLHDVGLEKMRDIICEQSPPRPSTHLSSLSSADAMQIATARQTHIKALAGLLRRELEWIPLKAIRKLPSERYDSPKSMADDIRRYIQGQPLEAGPESTIYRLRKTIRRNKGAFAAVALILTVLVVGIAVSTYFLNDSQREKRNAVIARDQARVLAYFGSIHAAGAAVERGDYASARRRLHAAAEVKRDEVHITMPFEWHYLAARSEDPVTICNEHKGNVHALSISPDGTRLATGGKDGVIYVRDSMTGKVVFILNEHEGEVHFTVFSGDGKLLASCGSDKTARIWDMRSGQPLHTLEGHEGSVVKVVFSPVGSLLATCSDDKDIRIYNASTGKQATLPLRGHTAIVRDIKFNADGTRIASCSSDKTVRIWDPTDGTELLKLEGHKGWVNSIEYTPDGEQLISCSEDKTIRIWNTLNGDSTVLKGHTNGVLHVTLNEEGTRLLSSSRDASVKVWDPEAGEVLQTLEGHLSTVKCAIFSHDSMRIASCSDDATIRVWDTQDGTEIATLDGHQGNVNSIVFNNEGTQLFSCSDDDTVRIWDPMRNIELLPLVGHERPVTSVAISPHGSRIASASQDNSIRIWDATLREEVVAFHGHTRWVNDVAFNRAGTQLVTGSDDGTVRVWDLRTGDALATFVGHRSSVNEVAFSPDDSLIASCSFDNTVRIWDMQQSTQARPLMNHTSNVSSIAFNKDGSQLASGSWDGTVRIWNPRILSQVHALVGHEEGVSVVLYSPDSSQLASGSLDNSVRIWDAKTGRLEHVLDGHDLRISALAFSPDGQRLASTSWDGSICIWDTHKGDLMKKLVGHDGKVHSVEFHPDGSPIVTASEDRTIRVWDVESGEEVLALIGHEDIVQEALWNPAGNGIVSCSDDNTVRLWDAKSSRVTEHERRLAYQQRLALHEIVEQWINIAQESGESLNTTLEREVVRFSTSEEDILRNLVLQHLMKQPRGAK